VARKKAKHAEHDHGLALSWVRLSDVRQWPRNPKEHDVDEIEASMDRFGYVEPFVRDTRTGKLVAGHGRDETLTRKKGRGSAPPGRIRIDDDGEWLVPVIDVAFTSEHEAEAYLLASRGEDVLGW